MKGNDLLRERLSRIRQAVALIKVDRTPVVLEYSGFAAHVTGISMAEFLSDPEKVVETMIQAYRRIGEGDAVNYGSFWPYGLCYLFMCRVKVPGVDLPENYEWQMDEKELMMPEDYDRILEMGWPAFFEEFMRKRVLSGVPEERLAPKWKRVDEKRKWAALGVPVLTGGDVTTPIELLCGGRSLERFSRDLFKIPDKVEAAMERIAPHLAGKVIRRAKGQGYPAVWVGGWRSAPSMLSPAMWDRFVWPYFRYLVEEVANSGLIPILHLDSDWTRELARFKELPAGRCLMALDGETDIFKAKELLGDHMCIMGDVSASMFCMGAREEIYKYCSALIRKLGPEGFILHSGCDIPTNAKLENVEAMVAAALDSNS